MIFFSASFTQMFSSHLKFVLGVFDILRFRLNRSIAVKFWDSQIGFSIATSEPSWSLSTLSWSNSHWQYSSNHFCPCPSAPSASRSSPPTGQCVLSIFYSCYVVYLSSCHPADSTRELRHSVYSNGMPYPWPFPVHCLLFHNMLKLLMVSGISKSGGFCADFYFLFVCSFDTIFSVILHVSEGWSKRSFH